MNRILMCFVAAVSTATAAVRQVDATTPNRQPQLAASGSEVALVFGSGKAVMFARSTDRGMTFSKPVAIASMPVLPLTRHRGPRVAYAGKTMLVSAIGGNTVATGPHAHGLPSDGDLRVWRSADGGRTWKDPVVVNDAVGAAREGLHALATDQEGNALLVWLDLRSEGTKLYGAWSKDGGATWSRNFQVYASPDGTICQCCHPSLLALGAGEFAVLFRNALTGSRDMYTLRVREGKVVKEAKKEGSGTWPLNACPMDGGGLAMSGKRMVSAWRRGDEVFLSGAEGEIRIGEGKDVALAATADGVYAVWVAQGGIQGWASGKTMTLDASGSFPSLTALPDGSVLAAWEADGAIEVRRIE